MKTNARRYFLGALAACAMAPLAIPTTFAAEQKPAKIIVGFSPGGGFDAVARVIADALSKELNRTIMVENRPGAGSRVAVDHLRQGAPDGSVMMLGPDALQAMYPFIYKSLNYDPQRDLVPVSTIAEFSFSLMSGANPKVNNFEEFVKWAKANPDSASYGVSAMGSPLHFFGLMLGKAIDVPVQIVPFQGAAPVVTALMGGHISSGMSSTSSVVPLHQAGNVKILAVTSPERDPQLPDVPTFKELGYPNITAMSFHALYAPPGTPDNIVREWADALSKVVKTDAVRERFASLGLIPVGGTPEELKARVQESIGFWKPVIEESGYVAD